MNDIVETANTDTITLSIEMPAVLARKWLGEQFAFSPEKFSQSMRFRVFEYGLRVFNDTYPKLGELESEKVALLRDGIAEANKGAEFVGRSRGGAVTMSSLERLTMTIAKAELKRRFQVITKVAKIADMCEANAKVAAYFEGTVWIDAKVAEWNDSEQGKAFDAKGKAESRIAEMKALKAKVASDSDVELF